MRLSTDILQKPEILAGDCQAFKSACSQSNSSVYYRFERYPWKGDTKWQKVPIQNNNTVSLGSVGIKKNIVLREISHASLNWRDESNIKYLLSAYFLKAEDWAKSYEGLKSVYSLGVEIYFLP